MHKKCGISQRSSSLIDVETFDVQSGTILRPKQYARIARVSDAVQFRMLLSFLGISHSTLYPQTVEMSTNIVDA